ncbi:MAG: signal peptidase I [Promethearchaeota archaeon]
MKENSSETIPKKEKKTISKKKVIIAVVMIFVAFFGSFLIYFILQVALNTETPIVVVVSGSMKPTLNEGDLLFVRGINPAEIKNGTAEDKDGDIIVFDAHGVWLSPPDEPVVHRVVNKTYSAGHWYFQTKGDNDVTNPHVDGYPFPYWVPDYKIYGVVRGRIPWIGWIKIVLADSGLLIPLLIIISVVLIISIIRDALKEDDEKEKKRKKKELKTEEPA